MSRLNRLFIAFALLGVASFAGAESFRLVAPADGVTLRGGSFAELRWSATQLPRGAEEWEAFLSVDGGKYYAFRVTPHLDIDLQRFTFVVPNVDAHDARILIRTGNEVHETHFESRGSFSITRDPNAEQILPRLQFGRGEAAREGDPAVLAWTSGERNGSGITQQSSTTVPSQSFGRVTTDTSEATLILAPAIHSTTAASIASTRFALRDKHAHNTGPRPVSVDLLLVCSRWNV